MSINIKAINSLRSTLAHQVRSRVLCWIIAPYLCGLSLLDSWYFLTFSLLTGRNWWFTTLPGRTVFLPAAQPTSNWSYWSPSLFGLDRCTFKLLYSAREVTCNFKHCCQILKLSTVVRRRKNGNELSIEGKFISFLDHLMRTTNQIKVISF